ncbi:hypothetical protein [Mycobacterium sp. 852002-51057_SCH5723018]|uniref:hypothetical protein n=1 Tax=Mycobacterium sp. 852002-51057_SCH5723018 TaxID=1834094 RepID=UPI0012E7B4E2|nr:hypothetical protein [Mycobacterium sp. 852002-51057_SCH5723018]
MRQGRQFNFISMTPAPVLQELADRARRSSSCSSFYEGKGWLTNDDLRNAFVELSRADILGSVDRAWETLRGFDIRWPDERDLVNVNSALAGAVLTGAGGRLASVGLGDIAVNNLGVELTKERLISLLPDYGLEFTQESRLANLIRTVQETTSSWLNTTALTLLTPIIARSEAQELSLAAQTGAQLKFVIGDGGVGKTAVVHQAVSALRESGMPVLCFRLDRLDDFASTNDLGRQLGLEGSPVSALGAAAAGRDSVLVIDQLDAVSFASGRMSNRFDTIADVVREAAAFPSMRLLLVCRKFDVDNDHRIRGLSTRADRTVTVGKLSHIQVNEAVDNMHLNSAVLTDSQRSLLAYPVNLTLLSVISEQPNALRFEDAGALFDLYWDRKRRDINARRPSIVFDEAVQAVAAEVSRRQRLSVPRAALDRLNQDDYDVLISEHVLVQDQREIAFFHESLFDYAFARYWVSLEQSLVAFLLEGEQELFRRAQVRQILSFLRSYDAARFVREFDNLLRNQRIRYHIKHSVLAVIGKVVDPTSSEARALMAVSDVHPEFELQLWMQLRSAAWFNRLNTDGYLAGWLSSRDERLQNRAIAIMAGASEDNPDDVAAVLSNYRVHDRYADWLGNIISRADIGHSRPLFDLLLNGVREGLYANAQRQLGFISYRLAEQNSDWGLELLKAHFIERRGAMDLNEDGRVEALTFDDHGLAQLIRASAIARPKEFCEAFLPYMIQVMTATQVTSQQAVGWPTDRQFSGRYRALDQSDEASAVLLSSMVDVLRGLTTPDALAIRGVLRDLAGHPYDSAQFLLYQAFIGTPSLYADWAAELLVATQERLFCGYLENSMWTTRLLLQAINDSISDTAHERVEVVVRDLLFPWEGTRPGWYAFTLLSALSEGRLSEVGRRRLGEYRRRFDMAQPTEPVGVVSGWIAPPIPREAVVHMTDTNWLQAIERHRDDQTDWSRFTGGAHELSALLREETTKDPIRFAGLALRLSSDTHPSYGTAILNGFSEGPAVDDPEPIFDAIRYIADLRDPEHDRWIGSSLDRYNETAPIDLVQRVLERALNSADPVNDRSIFTSPSNRSETEQLYMAGMNSARGANALSLGDLLLSDADGTRTQLVIPYLDRLAVDPVLAVRSCVAHVLAGAFRHARAQGVTAFWRLVEPRSPTPAAPVRGRIHAPRPLKQPLQLALDLANRVFRRRARPHPDDVLLATNNVQQVLVFIGNDDPPIVRAIIRRMLASAVPEVRTAGGRIAALAGFEWECTDLLRKARTAAESEIRVGVAQIAAQRLKYTTSRDAAAATLRQLFNDPVHEVRQAASYVAAQLRGEPLTAFNEVIAALIVSAAYTDSVPQLLITLQYATDRIDDLVLAAARRFIESLGDQVADLRTSAAGDAHYITELVLRGLAQTDDTGTRSALLDIVDSLVLLGAYGIEEAIEQSAR